MKKIRLALIDDHKLLTDTWTVLFNSHPQMEVVAVCNLSENALALIQEVKPDIVLADISMTPIDGIELTRLIKRQKLATQIIGVSLYAMPAFAKKMIGYGAKGYVTKNSSKEELFDAILQVSKGGTYICQDIKDNIARQHSGTDKDINDSINTLTFSELKIVRYIKQGLSSKEIAEQTNSSFKTIEVHRYHILKKLGVSNVASLVNEFNVRGL